jgi:sugar diacid utilization regulator
MEYKAGNQWNESLCFICKGRVLLFINMDRSTRTGHPDLFETLVGFSKDHLLITGVSLGFRGMNHLCAAYEQTKTAIEYGTAYHPSDFCYFFEDCALDYMIRSCKGAFQNEEICSSKLLLLAQYDKEKGTDYYKTLHTYFIYRFNAAEAAKKLFINRSTFHYRLDRIQELVNINFDSEDERLYLAMSFKILAQ